MGRPHRITPQIAAKIDALRAGGLLSKAGLLRALAADGERLNPRTLAAYLASAPPVAPAARIVADTSASTPAPAVDDAAIQKVLDGDEANVADLAKLALEVREAINAWGAQVRFNPTAARTLATLTRTYGELVAKISELRPRPEVEADRLEALGVSARVASVERARARARADEDLRGRVRRQQAVIDSLVDGAPDGS